MQEQLIDFANMTSDQTKRLNELSNEYRYKYAGFIDRFCEMHIEESHLYSLPIVTRSVFCDHTYLNICRMLLLREEMERYRSVRITGLKRWEEVYAKKIINEYTGKGGGSAFLEKQSEGERQGWFSRVLSAWYYDFRFFKCHFCDIPKYANQELNDSEKMIITPLLSSTCVDGRYYDRYFTDIGLYIEDEIDFVPMVIFDDKRDARELLGNLSKDQRCHFVFYEKSLLPKDLAEIIGFRRFCRKLKKERFLFCNIDITEIVHDSLMKSLHRGDVYEGLLCERFLMRLSKKKPDIKSFLVWFEGRPLDLQIVSSIRKYFPDAQCIAYELFPFDRGFQSLFFTDYECEIGHAPTKVVVPGGFGEEQRKYSKQLRVQEAPILRSQYTYRPSRERHDENRIMLVLSYDVQMSADLLETLDRYFRIHRTEKRYHVIVKNHPTNSDWKVSDYTKESLCYDGELVNGTLGDCLEKADIVITGSTTSSLEVLFNGAALIILCKRGSFISTGLPDHLPKNMYFTCYGQEDFNAAMDQIKMGWHYDNSILKDMLLPVNKQTVSSIFE